MNQKAVLLITVIILVTVGVYGWWIAPESECERLVKSNQNRQVFPVCMEFAKLGNAYAQNVVGVSYASGDGVKKDAKKAFYWFEKSAFQNFAKAQSNIALGYLDGEGVERNHAKAIRWWKLAASQGEPNAQFNLAVSFANGYGINQDIEAANQLMFSALFSYLKSGNLKQALRCVKYIHITWPWSESHESCSQSLQASLQGLSCLKVSMKG